jgi:hypothetical protein
VDFKSAVEQGLIDKHKHEETGPKVQANRKDKRRNGRAAKGLSKRRVQIKGSTDRLLAQGVHTKASRKTGGASWDTPEARAEHERQKMMRSISTKKLRPLIGDAADTLHKSGVKNLLDLSRMETAPALPPGTLRSIRNYLDKSGISRAWT